jgi:hypothetical protein
MADEEPRQEPFGRRLRYFLRSQRYPIAILVFVIGIVLSTLAIGDFTPLNTAPPFNTIDQSTDPPGGVVNYNLIFVIAGPIVLLIGGYFVGSYYLARQKFEHLMLTKSKAEFLRNIPEVEMLLYELTPADEQRYNEKIVELRLRR